MDTTAIAHMQETKFFKSHSIPFQTACTELSLVLEVEEESQYLSTTFTAAGHN